MVSNTTANDSTAKIQEYVDKLANEATTSTVELHGWYPAPTPCPTCGTCPTCGSGRPRWDIRPRWQVDYPQTTVVYC